LEQHDEEEVWVGLADGLSQRGGRLKDWLVCFSFSSFFRALGWLVRFSFFNFFKVLGVAIIGIVLIESLRPVVRIDPFIMPEEFEKEGFTAQTFGNQLGDEIEKIKRSTTAHPKLEEFSSTSIAELPDVEVPQTGLSLRTLIGSLQDLL
jgi:hypothetical protein